MRLFHSSYLTWDSNHAWKYDIHKIGAMRCRRPTCQRLLGRTTLFDAASLARRTCCQAAGSSAACTDPSLHPSCSCKTIAAAHSTRDSKGDGKSFEVGLSQPFTSSCFTTRVTIWDLCGSGGNKRSSRSEDTFRKRLTENNGGLSMRSVGIFGRAAGLELMFSEAKSNK